jgi:hypothetical protein
MSNNFSKNCTCWISRALLRDFNGNIYSFLRKICMTHTIISDYRRKASYFGLKIDSFLAFDDVKILLIMSFHRQRQLVKCNYELSWPYAFISPWKHWTFFRVFPTSHAKGFNMSIDDIKPIFTWIWHLFVVECFNVAGFPQEINSKRRLN